MEKDSAQIISRAKELTSLAVSNPKLDLAVKVLQTLLHFVVTQCRAVILFYFSYQGYQAMVLNWTAFNYLLTPEQEMIDRNVTASLLSNSSEKQTMMPFLDFQACVSGDAALFMSSWSTHLETKCLGTVENKMYGLPYPLTDNVILSTFNMSALILVVMFVVILTVDLIRSRTLNFGHGSYIAFTWKVQSSRRYAVCAWLLVIFNIILLADCVRFAVRMSLAGFGSKVLGFLTSIIPACIGLMQSAWSLCHPSNPPRVDYHSEEFDKLRFYRSWSSIVVDNTSFFHQVTHAMYFQKFGLPEELDDLTLPGYSREDEVMDACKPYIAKIEEGGGRGPLLPK